MANTGLHISLSAEPVFHIGGLIITNSILTSLIVSILLILFAITVSLNLQKKTKPAGLQNFAEFIIEALYGLVHSVTNDKQKTSVFFPFVASFFLFIIMNNYLGLIPGVGTIGFLENPNTEIINEQTQDEHSNLLIPQVQAETHVTTENIKPTAGDEPTVVDEKMNEQQILDQEVTPTEEQITQTEHSGPKFVPLFRAGTADLNTTIALALTSMFMVQFFGIKFLGLKYFKKFFDFSNPINAYVGVLELVSEFAKIISFAFRLFGNIFAGEVLLAVIGFLVPVIAPMPFYGLELFVGFIQALVFAMLSLVFFNMATQGHSDH